MIVVLRSDFPDSRMKRDLEAPIDILITTPKVFLDLYDSKHVFFTEVKFAVVDEADILLSNEFKSQVDKILTPCKSVKAQFVFALATINSELKQKLVDEYPVCNAYLW